MAIALKKIMDEKKITVPELVEKTGLTKNMIWAYQSGRNNPDPETLCALADILDVSLDMLIRGKEKDRPEGRSLKEMVNDYENLPDEVLEMNIVVSQAILAERRLHARQEKDGKENP